MLVTVPLRMLQLRSVPNPLSAATPSVKPASFTPIGIPPLTIALPSSANAQLKWVTGTPPPQPQTFMLAGIPQEAANVNFTVSPSTTIRWQLAVCHASQDNSVNGPAQPAARGSVIRQINGLAPEHVTFFVNRKTAAVWVFVRKVMFYRRTGRCRRRLDESGAGFLADRNRSYCF